MMRRAAAAKVAAAPVVGLDDALSLIDEVLVRAARGDLEARVPAFPADADPALVALAALAHNLNHTLDVVDAFVREAGATLDAAAHGRFYRQFLIRGLPGTFRDGADRINTARHSMQATAAKLAEEEEVRNQMVDAALQMSTQVASAATELGASAESLATSARSAVSEASGALSTMETLERSSSQIQDAVNVITRVAAQTRLLSLNATIEAARAGDAGRGFAVVANEVRTLASETSSSSADITSQVQEAQRAASAAAVAIASITQAISEIDAQVDGIACAAGGQGGLSELAETLRTEIAQVAVSA